VLRRSDRGRWNSEKKLAQENRFWRVSKYKKGNFVILDKRDGFGVDTSVPITCPVSIFWNRGKPKPSRSRGWVWAGTHGYAFCCHV